MPTMSVLADFHLLPVDSQKVLGDPDLFERFRAGSPDELHGTGAMVLALQLLLEDEGIELFDSTIDAEAARGDSDAFITVYDVEVAQKLLTLLAGLKQPAELCARHLESESDKGKADPREVAALVEGLGSLQRCLARVTATTLGVLVVAP